jgi:ribonuclease D
VSEPSPELATAPTLLRAPVDGVPQPITTRAELARVVTALLAGSGPIAIDAERASGYRYGQRAYLVQLRRPGAGTHLIDPIALPDLHRLGEAAADAEWILHAANQDLPCLAELGLRPRRLFDTELAGRLLGDERVALGTMVEQHLGVRLEKVHSAVDWSTRPLPHDWLAYAALDVELLGALRESLSTELAAAGKAEWAKQEFEAVRVVPPPEPREDPWRRTSGIHGVRSRRQLSIVRALWYARDEFAAQRDIAPGRVLTDAAIVAAARANPRRPAELAQVHGFGGPRQRRNLDRWFAAVRAAQHLRDDELVAPAHNPDAMPPPTRWRERDPAAAGRLARAREALALIAAERRVLAQNLLAADVVRRLAWQPPQPLDEDTVCAALANYGARPWQRELTAPVLSAALLE